MAVGFTDGVPKSVRACTPDDDTDVTGCIGVFVGGAGNVALMGIHDSSAETLTGVVAGTLIPGNYKRVMSTGTTATNITLFY